MAVSGVNNTVDPDLYTQKSTTPTSTANSTMDLEDFYYLLAAQLKYQDADNPMDTSEMMSTLVQTQMIQAISQMTQTNTTTYAASMVGKEVTIAETDRDGMYTGEKKGTVTGVVLGDNPLIFVDGKSYYLSQIVAVGDVSKSDESQQTNKDQGGNGTGNTGGENDKSTTV